jgi:hypothetical protein
MPPVMTKQKVSLTPDRLAASREPAREAGLVAPQGKAGPRFHSSAPANGGLPMPMQSSQLERLAQNTLYHYDAAFFYEQAAQGILPDPEEPPVSATRNGNGHSDDREAPPQVAKFDLTPEEIEELQGLSDTHLAAAVMLDEVIALVMTQEPADPETSFAVQALARHPKRNDRSPLLDRMPTPAGRH